MRRAAECDIFEVANLSGSLCQFTWINWGVVLTTFKEFFFCILTNEVWLDQDVLFG